ncbi:hypothetical protein CRI94_13935 [Longibacter salinarum]|uniref:Uncharacterized protein n=1 Tax=Longibacter salinarum TaxID=1850348 RepID=A0A2A8CVI2_9BACT|nr:hypothetical protein CRI94_13935 [Longibacter salinarum]
MRHQTRNVSPSQAAESPAISFALQINAWIAFYDSLLRHRDRYVIAPFETVIGDIGVVTAALNKEFGTDFDLFEHTSENVAALHQERGYHAGPSKQRSAIKEGVRSAFERQADSNPTVKARLSDATRLYERWISMSSLHANS